MFARKSEIELTYTVGCTFANILQTDIIAISVLYQDKVTFVQLPLIC